MHLPARDKPWDCVNVVCLDDDARGSAAWKQANRAIRAARAAGHVVLSPTAGDAAIIGYRDNALREAHLISRRCWRRLRAAEDSIDGKHRFRRALPRGMTAYFYCCPNGSTWAASSILESGDASCAPTITRHSRTHGSSWCASLCMSMFVESSFRRSQVGLIVSFFV